MGTIVPALDQNFLHASRCAQCQMGRNRSIFTRLSSSTIVTKRAFCSPSQTTQRSHRRCKGPENDWQGKAERRNYFDPRLTHNLTHWPMDAWRKCWTSLDEIIREIIQWHPRMSIDFRLPTVRNQQVTRSSRVAGSNALNQLLRSIVCRVFIGLAPG